VSLDTSRYAAIENQLTGGRTANQMIEDALKRWYH